MKSAPVIAIDGPAGSGKSTVARKLAQRLSLRYLDSGAMYRAATWKALRESVDMNDEAALAALVQGMHVELLESAAGVVVLADGIDISKAIREPELTARVKYLARTPAVRKMVGAWQRKFGENGGIVAEGRDMTTVIFPDADVKFYLDASVETRARRRFDELQGCGRDVDLDELQREISERDRSDCERETAPLRRADDAVYVDTTGLTIEEVIGRLIAEVEARTG